MSSIKDIRPEFVEYIPKKEDMADGIIYISKEFKTASHLCLCGCKNLIVTPFGLDWWTLLIEDDKYITLSPSIGNHQIECKSHYIITRNKAYID